MSRRRASVVGVHARLITAVVVVIAGLSGCGGASRRVSVSLTPEQATVDVPFDLRISGLRGLEPVTISLVGRSTSGRNSHVQRRARADERGEVALSNQYFLAQMFPSLGVQGRYPATVRVAVVEH